MICGTLLLSNNNRYVTDEGKLPERPKGDKQLLKALVESNTVSQEGYDMLPPSMQRIATITHGEPTLPVTIREINGLSDLLLVVRSYISIPGGKEFRLDNFQLISSSGQYSIYKRKK